MTQEKITSLFFEGQQWTQRDYGTPYQSVRVWANGRLLGTVGISYGYGRQYEQFALNLLKEHNLITEQEGKQPAWKLEEKGITLYSSLSHVKKSELVKTNIIAENIARFTTI
jgi:hypothetical protein